MVLEQLVSPPASWILPLLLPSPTLDVLIQGTSLVCREGEMELLAPVPLPEAGPAVAQWLVPSPGHWCHRVTVWGSAGCGKSPSLLRSPGLGGGSVGVLGLVTRQLWDTPSVELRSCTACPLTPFPVWRSLGGLPSCHIWLPSPVVTED